MIEAGRLRHRINIQALTVTQDATTGEITESWSDLHTSVPAAVEPLSVKEFMSAQSVQSEITTRIVIRYRAGLTPDMRIVYKSKIYNPAGFLTDMESGIEYITIPCSEGVNDG
jgi:SPP1 family predicted phage head-tail adaptor